MLDLKYKLLAAGLVTQAQVDKISEQKLNKKTKRPPLPAKKKAPVDDFEMRQRQKQLEELKSLARNEQYDLIRRWVIRNRIDLVSGLPSDNAQKYFFQKVGRNISWLTLEPEVYAQVVEGKAGIMAFMSNHGLAHCVLPYDIIEDVASVFPEWLRVLKGHTLNPVEPD